MSHLSALSSTVRNDWHTEHIRWKQLRLWTVSSCVSSDSCTCNLTLAWSQSETLCSKPFICATVVCCFPFVLTCILPLKSPNLNRRCESWQTNTRGTASFAFSQEHSQINPLRVHSHLCPPWSLFMSPQLGSLSGTTLLHACTSVVPTLPLLFTPL